MAKLRISENRENSLSMPSESNLDGKSKFKENGKLKLLIIVGTRPEISQRDKYFLQ